MLGFINGMKQTMRMALAWTNDSDIEIELLFKSKKVNISGENIMNEKTGSGSEQKCICEKVPRDLDTNESAGFQARELNTHQLNVPFLVGG